MGRLSEYFRSHRPGLGFSIAEGVLKSSATVLLLASLALVAFDGFVLVALRLMVPEDAARSVATDIKDALEHTPWILWAFLASGVAAFLVGVLGLAAAHARSLAVLNLFLFLQAALLIYQACLAALSFKRSVWDGALPPPSDTSPAAAHVRAFLEARLPLFQASGPLLLGLQAVSLTGAACVQSYYLAAHEAMDEEPEDEVWSRRRTTAGTRGGKSSAVARAAAAPQRRPLLPPAGSPEAPR